MEEVSFRNLEDRQYLYKRLIEKFGESTQLVIAIEELSELIKEVTKAIRNESVRENLIEEIADVMIMLEQIRLIYRVPVDTVKGLMYKKCKRTVKRYFEEKGE